MATESHDNLLSRLAGQSSDSETADPWAKVAATQPDHEVSDEAVVETGLAAASVPRGGEMGQLAGQLTNQLGHVAGRDPFRQHGASPWMLVGAFQAAGVGKAWV